MLRTLVRALPLVLVPFCFFAAVIAAGRWTGRQLREREDGLVAFAAIECTAPEGTSRGEFLDEVQYVAAFPDRLSVLDEGLATRLVKVFSSHPRVEEVRRAEVRPYRRVRVELKFREPVLLVGVRGESTEAPQYRAVDRHGVLLPVAAAKSPLPLLKADVPLAAGPAGTPWGDQRVADAAALAGFLQPRDGPLRWKEAEIDTTAAGLVLHHQGRRILWGKPPGQEGGVEAAAGIKWQRLVEVLGDKEVADGRPYDLRPIQGSSGEGAFALARP